MRKILLIMLFMLCCGVCWGENDYGIRTGTETAKCDLCPNTTNYNYTYFEGEIYLSSNIIFANLIHFRSRTGYMGFRYKVTDEYFWVCPDCFTAIIKGIYKFGKQK